MIHLRYGHSDVPLCGRASWTDLTSIAERCECWECASINGTSHISHPHLLTEEELLYAHDRDTWG
jgi:hypothetical protein